MRWYTIFSLIVIIYAHNAPEVEIKQGKLEGKYMKTKNGKDIMGFLGIPYAKPPINELRFKDPIPADKWSNILKADKDGSICIQIDIFTNLANDVIGVEDCLYLNVFTPKLPKDTNESLSVMVFLHGGAFVCGSGDSLMYGPEYLLDEDIILVVPNYRLGPLGFITSGDDVVPGNMGLKDQVLVLKWVQENIAKFAGNPNSVTIFGDSAGGASVHYHMVSPQSKGLFHKAIAQSGTSINSWAIAYMGETKRNTIKLAKSFNCSTENSEEVIKCLRNVDEKEMVARSRQFLKWDIDPVIPYKPVVEHKHPNAFISQHPREIMKQGKENPVPLILGLTSNEGCLRAATLYPKPKVMEEFSNNFDKIAPISLLYEHYFDVENVTKQIKQFYFKDKVIGHDTFQQVIDMYTDAWFAEGIADSAKLHLKYAKTPVYLYYFDYKGRASTSIVFNDPNNDYGVCHGDDLFYLFTYLNTLILHPIPENDVKLTDVMTKLWANFAKTGKPTLNNIDIWKPVSSESIEYLHIKNNINIKMDKNLLKERLEFWSRLPIFHNKGK